MSYCPKCDGEVPAPEFPGGEWPDRCPDCGVEISYDGELVGEDWKSSVCAEGEPPPFARLGIRVAEILRQREAARGDWTNENRPAIDAEALAMILAEARKLDVLGVEVQP